MYLTSHRIQYDDGSQKDPILSFLYEHNSNLPPTPREVEELLGQYETDTVTLVAQPESNEGIEKGGNPVISYLDIVAPNNLLSMEESLNFLRESTAYMLPYLAGANLPYRYWRPLNEMETVWIRFGLGDKKYRFDRNAIDEFEELVSEALSFFDDYDHG